MEFANPKITEVSPKTLVMLTREFTMASRSEIPQLWQRYFELGVTVENAVPGAMWGASFGQCDDRFSYGVGVEVSKVGALPDGFCTVQMVGGTYAVLSQKINVSQFPAMFDHVYQTWMPKAGYEPAEGAVAERYPHNPDETPDAMTCEVWAPIKPKG